MNREYTKKHEELDPALLEEYKDNHKTSFLATRYEELLRKENETKAMIEQDDLLQELAEDDLKNIQEQKMGIFHEIEQIMAAELRRRFSFEFDGMRMHEYYFEGFESGSTKADSNGAFAKAVGEKYGDWNRFIDHFKAVGMSRGIGWAVLYYDPKGETPHSAWVSDHELGTLTGLPVLLAMDMWEHAFMVDYMPSEKKDYINAFLSNLNWSVVEERFQQAN